MPDNIDKLIDIRTKMSERVNNFEHDARGKSGDELDEVQFKFANDYNKLSSERIKLLGSAGLLNIGRSPPGVDSGPQAAKPN